MRAILRQSQHDSIATAAEGRPRVHITVHAETAGGSSKLHGLRVIRAEMRQRTSRSDAKWVTMRSSLGSLDNLQGCETATTSPVTFSSHVHMPGWMELLMSLWIVPVWNRSPRNQSDCVSHCMPGNHSEPRDTLLLVQVAPLVQGEACKCI
jgi:hypothetical protein